MARRRTPRNDVPAIEWVTGLAGLAIVLAMLGAIGRDAARGAGPPFLEAVLGRTEEGRTGLTAAIVVRNTGGRAAADVIVEGTIRASGGEEVRSRVRLDYVPGRSERHATLMFPSRPLSGGVTLRVLGYTTP